MGHAYDQMPIHKVEDQAAMINRSMDIIERFTGTRPVGWLGPGLTQTMETPELLAEAGVKYIGDWVYDDEPTVIRTAKGPLVTLPYTIELNDIPMMIVQHHESDYLLKRTIDQFDRLYAEGKDRAKIVSLAIHPYISGQPHRIKYLEAIYDYVNRFDGVLHWNGAEILDWYPGRDRREQDEGRGVAFVRRGPTARVSKRPSASPARILSERAPRLWRLASSQGERAHSRQRARSNRSHVGGRRRSSVVGNSDRALLRQDIDEARRMSVVLEAREAPRLRFVGIDRKGVVDAAARDGPRDRRSRRASGGSSCR